MHYLPTFSLVLFILLSHQISCALSKKEFGWCEAPFQCGNITAGFPFWGRNRPQVCGHPLLELHCFGNYTALIISNHPYKVLHIDQTVNTLRLARAELHDSFCNATFTATSSPPEIFELSPNYKSLTVFYLCDPKLPYRSSYTCPDSGRGLVSVSQNLDYHNSCRGSFTINVPKSFVPEEKELNITNLENALREGFEVKVKINEKACQECISSHGICGFNNTTQVCCEENSSSGCNTLHPPNNNELHTRCAGPFECGNQKELFYPFWTSGREDCGPPEFKLGCSSDFSELSISSVKFRIVEVNYDSGVIRLARSDDMGDLCPHDPLNMPLNETVLPFASNTELLTIYYNCSPDIPRFDSISVGDFPCEDETDGVDGRAYYVTRNLSSSLLQGPFSDIRKSCSRNVSIPASGPALTTLQHNRSRDNLKKVLEAGFELGLKALNQECLRCLGSGGSCGFSQISKGFACYCIDETHSHTCGNKKKDAGLSTRAIAEISTASVMAVVFLLAVVLFGLNRRRRRTQEAHYTRKDLPIHKRNQETSHFPGQQYLKVLNRQKNCQALIPLKQYSYAQVKRTTNSFEEVIGRGGFGIVYRGTLCDGRRVAVKVLNNSKGNNGEDFLNEVASISQTSHVNIVTLLGFCSEGSKQAIIYDFLENGSLDKFISSKRSLNKDWRELYGIMLGVAHGLEYLHHGCRTRIVHFDIKPQNVLLDDNLCPKLSDFGLAKLCERKESMLSLLDTRGTIGYIAPEVFSRVYGRVSHKSDVYSYGMLVLEMIGAKNKPANADTTSSTSSMYFPEWIYKDLEKGGNERFMKNGISNEEEEIVRKMTLVGLWCIQSWPSDRPSMNRVVEMIEGNLNALELPPKPVLEIPAGPLQETSMISDNSISAEICSMNVA